MLRFIVFHRTLIELHRLGTITRFRGSASVHRSTCSRLLDISALVFFRGG